MVLEDIAGHGTITFAGNKVTMRDVGNGSDSSSIFAFTLDTSASPRHIEHQADRPVPPTDFGATNTMTLILRREKR